MSTHVPPSHDRTVVRVVPPAFCSQLSPPTANNQQHMHLLCGTPDTNQQLGAAAQRATS